MGLFEEFKVHFRVYTKLGMVCKNIIINCNDLGLMLSVASDS